MNLYIYFFEIKKFKYYKINNKILHFSFIFNSSHKISRIRCHPVEFRLGEIKTRILKNKYIKNTSS